MTATHLPLPSRAPAPTQVHERELRLHGQRIPYLETGADSGGPVVVLVHGLASSRGTWARVLPALGSHVHAIAPDLLGSGDADKPRDADYSVGAHAARLRDLLRELGIGRASLVGHSYGGGVAMAFGYQFPERTERLVLIASGGLGPDLTILLRLASLPGATMTAHALATVLPRWLTGATRRTLSRLGVVPPADLHALGRAVGCLGDRAARRAFNNTVRSTVCWSGQRLAATDRLYLLAGLPTLLIAGSRDSCIPHQHSRAAHETLPGSRLEVLDAGHFPHQEHPDVVGGLLAGFLAGPAATPLPAHRAAAC